MRARRWHTCYRAGDDGCGRGCGLFTGPVLTRIRGVCKLPKQSANATQIRTGCGHIIINSARPKLGGSLRDARVHATKAAHLSPSPRSLQKSCIRRRRGEFAAPVAQAPGSPTLSRRVLQQQRHRGASTPTTRHRQRSLRRRIPRRHTDRRTTGSQHHLDHGLGPQQSAKAR